jgi:hypothetical protein
VDQEVVDVVSLQRQVEQPVSRQVEGWVMPVEPPAEIQQVVEEVVVLERRGQIVQADMVLLEAVVETVQILTHHFSLSFPHPCLVIGKRLQVVDTLQVVEEVEAGLQHKVVLVQPVLVVEVQVVTIMLGSLLQGQQSTIQDLVEAEEVLVVKWVLRAELGWLLSSYLQLQHYQHQPP